MIGSTSPPAATFPPGSHSSERNQAAARGIAWIQLVEGDPLVEAGASGGGRWAGRHPLDAKQPPAIVVLARAVAAEVALIAMNSDELGQPPSRR
jgi:hypothetical protein